MKQFPQRKVPSVHSMVYISLQLDEYMDKQLTATSTNLTKQAITPEDSDTTHQDKRATQTHTHTQALPRAEKQHSRSFKQPNNQTAKQPNNRVRQGRKFMHVIKIQKTQERGRGIRVRTAVVDPKMAYVILK